MFVLHMQELIQQAAGVLDTNCFELKTVTKVINYLYVLFLNSLTLPLVWVSTEPRQGSVLTGSSI